MEELLEKFAEPIKTREDLLSLLEEIEVAKRRTYTYKQTTSLSDKLSEAVSEKFRQNIKFLESEGKLPESVAGQAQFLNKLKKYLANLPVLTLTLAFPPREEFINRLSSWLAEKTGGKIILDILVKEEIIGGAIIEFGGEYRDYSLGKDLEAILQQGNVKI